jgi:thiamine biosynthesis lipoprotein
MGCLVALDCEARDESQALASIGAAWAAICQVVRLMDPAAPGGDLARINAASPGSALHLDPWTTQVLRLSRRLCLATGGLFDPALPGSGSVRSLADLGGNRWQVRARTQLDLGGIAKGFAVDRAIQAMRAQGAHAGLVNAGGDLRLFGRRPRTLYLRSHTAPLEPLSLRSGALACSEPGAPGAPPAHRGYYRGSGADEAGCLPSAHAAAIAPASRAVAVLAQDCARADAMTKVFMQADGPLREQLERRVGVRCLAL